MLKRPKGRFCYDDGMFNKTLDKQILALRDILAESEQISRVLAAAEVVNPPNWYLGAGCVTQPVWNKLHDFHIDANIKDCDLVYYDPDTSKEKEEEFAKKIKEEIGTISLEIDVVNEARVHLWYEEEFGLKIPQYQSVEDGVNSWPTTITSIAVAKRQGKFEVYAPFGLNDLFGLILRPNKTMVTKEMYEKKVAKWTKIWPKLKVVDWDN
jgi:hypothetical protein